MIKAFVAFALVLGGVDVLTTPADAAAPSASAGTYAALAHPTRVASNRTVKAGRTISVRVGGTGPVMVVLSASGATRSGGLVAFGARRPSTTNLQFAKGASTADTAVVPVSAGRIHVRNTARLGLVKVSVDVYGRFAAGAASNGNPGVFHALPTARRAASLRIGARRAVNVQLGSRAGVPPEPGAVAVTLTVSGAARSGALLIHRPDEPQQNLPVVRFAAARPVSSFAVLRTSGGKATLVNTSSRVVRVRVDVAGWFVLGFAQTARTFQTLVPTHVWSAHVGAGRSAAITVGGHGGVPLRGVSAVLAVVHAINPARAGSVQAWRYGTRRPKAPVALRFAAGRSASNELLIPVSATGKLRLRNSGRSPVALALDVHGYVPSTTLVSPTKGATARYLRSGSTDAATMQTQGADDAAAGNSFVLLDVGAQTNDQHGVQLTDAAGARLTYAELVTALNAYLAGFATGGHTGTVAIGTNNDANDWTHYTGTARGRDWAIKVVRAASAPAGVSLLGADDIEAGFFSTEPQAAAWKASFLTNMPGAGTALVFNGSADFCPPTWTRNAPCNFGWTYARLYALAGGARTVVLPQVYRGYMATEWAMINATGGGRLRFLGSLTDYALDRNKLTPAQGWVALQRAMSSVTRTPIGRRAADIR